MVRLDAMACLEEGLRQLLTLRIAGTAATLLTFPQAAVALQHQSLFRVQRGGLSSLLGSSTSFSGEIPGRSANPRPRFLLFTTLH